ncbi:MAG: hypothetical protein HC781_06365 [Leptolyngbyaceae cyanobacterium CSU_1_4]|nr:hypothetical protein [Leptolyngbyaceae cyanobacterium CSU_1_4]
MAGIAMPVTLNTNIINTPGVHISESTAGLIPAGLATHDRVYIVGTGAQGDFNTPKQVISTDDLTNQFGLSPSLDAMALYFANNPNGVAFFVRAGAPGRIDIQVGVAVTGVYTVPINGSDCSFAALAGGTQADIVQGLVNAVNNNATVNGTVKAIAGTNGLIRLETLVMNASFTIDTLVAPGGSSLTAAYWSHTINLATPANGTWGITINSTAVSYASTGGQTLTAIVAALASAVKNHLTVGTLVNVSDITATSFKITAKTGALLALSSPIAPAGSTTSSTPSPVAPLAQQFITAIQRSFDPDFDSQGFIIAPEAFATLVEQSDRVNVGVALENHCSTEGFDWKTLIDAGAPSLISSVDRANVEGLLYTTARGHSSYFYPYVRNLQGTLVPPSAAIAGIAIRRYRDQGFQQPPAGGQYPVKGVSDVAVRIGKAQQAVSNPLGINLIRYFPNQGVLVYGARTRSSNPYYRFINTRVILNVLIGTLREAFQTEVFSAVDGQGVLFMRLRQTAEAICYQLWDGGALFGAQPEDAFRVICDRSNNPALDLENGIVRVDVYVATAPTAERILIGVTRVAIDQVQIVTQGLAAL